MHGVFSYPMYAFKEAVNAKRWSTSMSVETNYAFQMPIEMGWYLLQSATTINLELLNVDKNKE